MPKYHVIDYDTFLPRLVAGLRKAWEEVRRQRSGETFYMFGIATDSDVVVLTPFWNTEEKYAVEGNPEYPTDKWVVPKEGYEPCKYTAALQHEVNRYFLEVVMQGRIDSESAFEKRKARLLEIFEQALVLLDKEGFFGTGTDRHRVLLMIDRGDCSEDETKYMVKVIKRINPPESTVDFFRALKEQERKDAARKLKREAKEKPIKDLAIEFLRREKRPFDRVYDASRCERVTPFMLQFLPGQRTPEELWEVCFEAKGEPNGRLHGPDRLIVWVNPGTGECAIAP